MKNLVCVVLCLLLFLFLSSTEVAFASVSEEQEGQSGILLVAFGTSEPDARPAVDNIFHAVRSAFPGSEVRLSYTSNIIRRKILETEGLAVDAPTVALAKMQDEGFSSVTVQSLHIIPGEEFFQVEDVVRSFASMEGKYAFERLSLGKPLLYCMEDYVKTVALLKTKYVSYTEGNGAVVFMGHGTSHSANSAYSLMQLLFDEEGLPFVMGLVEAFPDIESVKRRVKELNPSKVTLVPFMVVAGDHAKNDMADEEDAESWFSVLKSEGYVVEPLLQGLGDGEGLPELFVDHILNAKAYR